MEHQAPQRYSSTRDGDIISASLRSEADETTMAAISRIGELLECIAQNVPLLIVLSFNAFRK